MEQECLSEWDLVVASTLSSLGTMLLMLAFGFRRVPVPIPAVSTPEMTVAQVLHAPAAASDCLATTTVDLPSSPLPIGPDPSPTENHDAHDDPIHVPSSSAPTTPVSPPPPTTPLPSQARPLFSSIAKPLSSAKSKRGRPPTRTTARKSFMNRITEMQTLALAGEPLHDAHSFWCETWPSEIAELEITSDNSVPDMLQRAIAFHSFMTNTFPQCTGLYCGKTTGANSRFNAHRNKRLDDEALVMLVLHNFPDESSALVAERELDNLLLKNKVPRWDRLQLFGGKGKVKGSGPAVVYVLLGVRRAGVGLGLEQGDPNALNDGHGEVAGP